MAYAKDVGDILANLCQVARTHNVDIRIRQVEGNLVGDRVVFELQLDRGRCHAVETVDITPKSHEYRWPFVDGTPPSKTMEYAFERALHNIKRENEKERTAHD